MPTTARELKSTRVRASHAPPVLGLLALGVPFAWKPIAHALSVLSHTLLHGTSLFIAYVLAGFIGFALVWAGLRRDELTATFLGFLGGSLIFMFWVEPSFALFAELMAVAPLEREGRVFLTPNLVLMEASAVIYLVVLIFTGANKDTRCRMFLWFHRNFRLRPNAPTPGYKRQFARIAAMETVFISWFFYLVIIAAVDPRFLGPSHPVTYALFVAMLVWGLYLVVFKLMRYRAMAAAIRYGIPVAGILWYCVEMGAIWKWYIEVWVKPVEFPATNVMVLTVFLLLMWLANATRERGLAVQG